MKQKVTIGPAMLNRLVASRSNVPVETVAKVMSALDDVVMGQLASGARVRLFTTGNLEVIPTKATRRHNPAKPGTTVAVPAGEKIVYRTVRSG